ncbi:MAG: chemotaxis protein CheW [Leptospiraceae bacterium]|nr:chemotaxis protein CheW [Leptospiraceae bacterium]
MADQNTDRYLELFLEESTEQIDLLNDGLLRLEAEGPLPEIVEDIFRSAHTLKSSAAFVGQNRMSELAHKMEDLLQQVREDKITIQTELVNLFFQVVDRVRSSLETIANGLELSDEFLDLKDAIGSYHESAASAAGSDALAAQDVPKSAPLAPDVVPDSVDHASPAEPAALSTDPEANSAVAAIPAVSAVQIDEQGLLVLVDAEFQDLKTRLGKRRVYSGLVSLDSEAAMKNMRFLLLTENLVRKYEIIKTDPPLNQLESDTVYETFRFIVAGDKDKDALVRECQIDLVVDTRIQELEYKAHAQDQNMVQKSPGAASQQQESRIQSKNIKVSSDKIDYLMNNVGELVIINSGLQKVYDDLQGWFSDTGVLTELKGKIDQSARIVRDLQSGIMKTRMMPVGLVFHRFARPIRDLARKLGKEVELHLKGEDTELDKNIIDVIGEPLLHIMRNSLDHGIESAAERTQKNKTAHGNLHLLAYQSGNNVFIEVRDDGRGLNREKILGKAIERGLVNRDAIPADDEIYRLIFHPGFSTAEQVTDVSGRGVGMGVVDALMKEFKGVVQIDNKPGEGCAFILSFPLTLAIISAVLVRLDKEEYAFPLADVVETIMINKDELTSLQGREIVNLRGDILSVYRLSRLMGQPESRALEELPMVIVSSANRKLGFIVDGFSGKMEIVIKSLERNFHSVKGLIGACLLGDGRIIMVLDVHGLLEMAHRKQDNVEQSAELLEAVLRYNQFVNDTYFGGRDSADRLKEALGKRMRELSQSAEPLTSDRPAPGLAVEPHSKSMPSHAANANVASVPLVHITDQRSTDDPEQSTGVALPGPEKGLSAVMEQEPDREQSDDGTVAGLESNTTTMGSLGEISVEDSRKLHNVVHSGMQKSGQVLSQLLGVQVKISIPEFKTIQFEELYLGSRGPCFAIQLPIEGGMDGMNLLIFERSSGLHAAGELMGVSVDELENMPAEDIESVLCELANICGSSILNEFSNTTGLSVMPGPPVFYQGQYESVIREIETHSSYFKEELQILYIMTDFFREEVEFFGRLYVIPSTRSMARLLNHL